MNFKYTQFCLLCIHTLLYAFDDIILLATASAAQRQQKRKIFFFVFDAAVDLNIIKLDRKSVLCFW